MLKLIQNLVSGLIMTNSLTGTVVGRKVAGSKSHKGFDQSFHTSFNPREN